MFESFDSSRECTSLAEAGSQNVPSNRVHSLDSCFYNPMRLRNNSENDV